MKKYHVFIILMILFSSCKDTDGDKIYDKDDKCPDTFGLVEFNGCPDSDDDGIIDSEDDCPEDHGLKEFNGCPDTDEDGIPDNEDDCPDDYGLEEFNGCPDSDGDGIKDSADDCPETYGYERYNGCLNNDHVPISVSECLKSYSFTKSEINRLFERNEFSLNSTIDIGFCNSIIEYMMELRRLDEEKKKIDAMDRELNEGYIFNFYRGDYGQFIIVQKGGRYGTYYLMQVLSGGICSSGGTMKFNESTYSPQKVWVRDEPFKIRATLFTMKLIDFSKNRSDLEQRFN